MSVPFNEIEWMRLNGLANYWVFLSIEYKFIFSFSASQKLFHYFLPIISAVIVKLNSGPACGNCAIFAGPPDAAATYG